MDVLASVLIILGVLMVIRKAAAETNVTDLHVGVLLISRYGAPYDAERTMPAIDLAVEYVNEHVLNASYRMVPIRRPYGSQCSAARAPGIAADLYYRHNTIALIGPGCTYALDPTARLAAFWNIPIVTGLGDSGMFLNKTSYPTLTRFAYCQCMLRAVFASVFRHFEWTDISIITDRDDYHSFVMAESIDHGLRREGSQPYLVKYLGRQVHSFRAYLEECSQRSRVIILCVPGDHVRRILLEALELGYMDNGDYVFMDVEVFEFKGHYWGDHSWYRGDYLDTKAKKAFESLLRIALDEPKDSQFYNFSNQVKLRSQRDFNFTYGSEKVNFFVGAFYDATYLLGVALNETLEAGDDLRDGVAISHRMSNRSFKGVTEEVHMDDNGDRSASYAILDMDPISGELRTVAHYWGDRPGYTPEAGASIHWPGGRGSPPPNQPFCGFKGDNPACKVDEELSIAILLPIILFVVFCFIFAVIFLIYRKRRAEAELYSMSWHIKYADLFPTGKSSSISRISVKSETSKTTAYQGQVFTTTASYKGQTVAVKTFNKKRMDLTRGVLLEIKTLRELQHDNMVRLVGACVENPWVLVITEYCPKGSLQDVIHSASIELDWDFKMSFISDISMGLAFLHSSVIKVHGRLRSSNCVIDGRFVLKLCDFGLEAFYKDCSDKSSGAEMVSKREKLLYVSPERLRNEKLPASQKGDIYSFSIILEELVLREGPFAVCAQDMTTEEILRSVMSGIEPPFRPQVSRDCCPEEVRDLMERCWQEDPASRPSAAIIKSAIKRMLKGSGNILDNLLCRMEQYANNLESIVEDRTHELQVEKKKTEHLLHQILPKSVASRLMQGKTVDPETYDSVTIYFSDIVGFTSLCSDSTPMQVVDLLNDLYTLFDEVIEQFDVYKVETIGDAYMVVSGLPIKNGDTHAREIARMSLRIIASIETFKVRHQKDYQMRIRIGLHTGSCVAGVVGLKMPRYCLFGDTVNTASRMESNGLPMKIHVSHETKDVLDSYRTFLVTLRGEIELKGKGTVTTYWLNGELPNWSRDP